MTIHKRKTFNVLLKFLFLIPIGIAVTFATTAESSGSLYFQRMEINSASKGKILDYEIRYGDHRAPTLRDRSFLGGGENILKLVSESMMLPIPDEADVTWKSEDQEDHEAHIPVRSLITDIGNFYGTKFLFVDDHVDLYLIYKIPNKSMYLNLQYTKVYSSHTKY